MILCIVISAKVIKFPLYWQFAHNVSRWCHCIQRWGTWNWTLKPYGPVLSPWSREPYKVQTHSWACWVIYSQHTVEELGNVLCTTNALGWIKDKQAVRERKQKQVLCVVCLVREDIQVTWHAIWNVMHIFMRRISYGFILNVLQNCCFAEIFNGNLALGFNYSPKPSRLLSRIVVCFKKKKKKVHLA